MNIEGVPPENNVHEMKAELSNLTYELNTVYRLTEGMKALCIYFHNEYPEETSENDFVEIKNKWKLIRSELKNRRLKEKNNSLIDGEKHKKNPVVDVASQLEPNEIERYFISIITLFLYEHPEGVNLNGIYSYANKFFKYATVVDIENVLKKYPQYFEESSPIESVHIHKKMRLINVSTRKP